MKIVVGLRTEQLKRVASTGIKPEFGRIFSNFSGVELLNVYGRGRFATFEIAPDILPALQTQFGDSLTFSANIPAEPF